MKRFLLLLFVGITAINLSADWDRRFYVDEFGDYTTDFYWSPGTVEGLFSNTATINSSCKFRVFVTPVDAYINVIEYGFSPINSLTNCKASIRIKKTSGERVDFTGYVFNGYVTINEYEKFVNLLNDNYLTVYISATEYGNTSTYLFSIATLNGQEVINEFIK